MTMSISLIDTVSRSDDAASSISKSSWIQYTAIGASALITLIIIIVLYDLCCRCQELKNQQISDGGPPASPSHQYIYKVGMKCDEASPSFDVRQSIIKVEMLDNMNRYLTGIAVPSYLFNFKQDKDKTSSSSQKQLLKKLQDQQQQQQAQAKTPDTSSALQMKTFNSGISQGAAAAAAGGGGASGGASGGANPAESSGGGAKHNALTSVKSMTTMHEIWSSAPRGTLVTFSLVRRQPLRNLSAFRVSHDCFAPNAHIKLKYIIVHDPVSKHGARVNLAETLIKAHHPCPPSGFQVYPSERITDKEQMEEMRSFSETMKRRVGCCIS